MILKLIGARIRANSRDRFAVGQRTWSALRNVPGFCGQIGGWDTSRADHALIIGLWRDTTHYIRFMRDAHDPIFESSGQMDTCDALTITLWDVLPHAQDASPAVRSALHSAGLLRIARCGVRPEQIDHFVQVQCEIWAPGMAAAGASAGAFCRNTADGTEFLVCSAWRSPSDHQRYLDGPFHSLRRRAEVDRDCRYVDGFTVRVEPDWTVSGAD